MLFWLFVITFIMGILLIITGQIGNGNRDWYHSKNKFKKFVYKYGDPGVKSAGVVISVVSVIAIVSMIVIILGNYSFIKEKAKKYKVDREYIMAQINDENCYNEYGLLERNTAYAIEDWNDFVEFHKKYQRNFWIGIFIPNVFDDLEPIDY